MRRISFNSESGAILPIVIILALALTITGLAFLNAGVMEHSLVRRRIYENQAFYLADAGIEHLKVKLYAGERPSMWPEQSEYRLAIVGTTLETTLGDGQYWVKYYDGNPPYVISTGQIFMGQKKILKKIRMTMEQISVFDFAIFGDEGISMKGNAEVHSYDHENPDFPLNVAQIATNSTAEAAIDVGGTAQVFGDAFVGVGGDPETGIEAPEGQITGDRGVLGEYVFLEPVTVPEELPVPIPSTLTVQPSEKGEDAYELPDGNWQYDSITVRGELVIDSDCTLAVGTLRVESQGQITIKNNADVFFYVYEGATVLAGGAIVNESQDPSLLHFYGTAGCESINLVGKSHFYGAIYAPQTEIYVGGDGDIYGSVVGRVITLPGGSNIFWDAALGGGAGDPSVIALGNWQELP